MSRVVSRSTAPAERASCELADILRRYGEAYRGTHGVSAAQRKAMWLIEYPSVPT